MTFLFNSDAQRATVFRDAFARDLPHLPFAIGPVGVDPRPGFTGVWKTIETVRKIYVTVS